MDILDCKDCDNSPEYVLCGNNGHTLLCGKCNKLVTGYKRKEWCIEAWNERQTGW